MDLTVFPNAYIYIYIHCSFQELHSSPAKNALQQTEPQQHQHYLWDELKQGVGVESANGQGYEVEQQSLVKGFLHEGHDARPDQRAQRDQCHA